MHEESKFKKYTAKEKYWGREEGNQLGGVFFNMYIRRKHITSPCLEQTSFL